MVEEASRIKQVEAPSIIHVVLEQVADHDFAMANPHGTRLIIVDVPHRWRSTTRIQVACGTLGTLIRPITLTACQGVCFPSRHTGRLRKQACPNRQSECLATLFWSTHGTHFPFVEPFWTESNVPWLVNTRCLISCARRARDKSHQVVRRSRS